MQETDAEIEAMILDNGEGKELEMPEVSTHFRKPAAGGGIKATLCKAAYEGGHSQPWARPRGYVRLCGDVRN